MTRAALWVGAALGVLAAAAAGALVQEEKERTAEGDQKALQGDWYGFFEEISGKAFDKKEIKERNRRLTIKGNKFTMKRVVNEKLGTYERRLNWTRRCSPRRSVFPARDRTGERSSSWASMNSRGTSFICASSKRAVRRSGRIRLRRRREEDGCCIGLGGRGSEGRVEPSGGLGSTDWETVAF